MSFEYTFYNIQEFYVLNENLVSMKQYHHALLVKSTWTTREHLGSSSKFLVWIASGDNENIGSIQQQRSVSVE